MRRALPLAAAVLLPPTVGLVLNGMRPDLWAPMLNHRFGYNVVALAGALTGLGATGVAVATYAVRNRVGRVALSLVSVLLGTLPAVLAVMFGPVVFAFWYGAAPGVE